MPLTSQRTSPSVLLTQRSIGRIICILATELATVLLRPHCFGGGCINVRLKCLQATWSQLSQPGPSRTAFKACCAHCGQSASRMAYAFGCVSSSARLLIISEGFVFFSLLRLWAYYPEPAGPTSSKTSLNADGIGYIWALWVSASSSLGLCQWLCMEAWGTLWCHSRAAWLRKASRCDACTLLQMRCHLLWRAAL